MDKGEFHKRKKEFIYSYFLEKFVEENKSKFNEVYIYEIYDLILSDEKLVSEFMEFIAQKLYLITYDPNEAKKVKEIFISELN